MKTKKMVISGRMRQAVKREEGYHLVQHCGDPNHSAGTGFCEACHEHAYLTMETDYRLCPDCTVEKAFHGRRRYYTGEEEVMPVPEYVSALRSGHYNQEHAKEPREYLLNGHED